MRESRRNLHRILCARRPTPLLTLDAMETRHSMKRIATAVGLAAAALMTLSGCGEPEASEISSAVQADGLDADMADCFAQGLLDADVSGTSLDVLAEDGIATDDGGQVQVVADDIPAIREVASGCGFELTG